MFAQAFSFISIMILPSLAWASVYNVDAKSVHEAWMSVLTHGKNHLDKSKMLPSLYSTLKWGKTKMRRNKPKTWKNKKKKIIKQKNGN
jgi:hypothetical protein